MALSENNFPCLSVGLVHQTVKLNIFKLRKQISCLTHDWSPMWIYSSLHLHMKDPSVFVQSAFKSQAPGVAHSFLSEMEMSVGCWVVCK